MCVTEYKIFNYLLDISTQNNPWSFKLNSREDVSNTILTCFT
jgi:hypothetical protein